MSDEVYDFIAIGLGPFNLSLACLAEPIPQLRGLFLERAAGFDWHPGMLIDDTTLQNPFLADLVSLADPTSRFSFLNYCKQEGRLYTFFIRERFYLSRAEYNRYCQWAVSQLDTIVFGANVEQIEYDDATGHYRVRGRDPRTLLPFTYRAAKLVIGIGSAPRLPACCEPVRDDCLHSAQYVDNKRRLQDKRSITVVGSGQSAAEVFHDLLKERDDHDYTLAWITRSSRFIPMETTRLSLEMTSPDYIDYLSSLPGATREGILLRQDSLYKGINAALINKIYDMLDDRRRAGRRDFRLITRSELAGCRYDPVEEQHHLRFIQLDQGQHYTHVTDGVIFATGYEQHVPRFIDGIRDRIDWDAQGRYRLSHHYAIDGARASIFVQNAAPHIHGLIDPDLGMGCHRNSRILEGLTGIGHYAIERDTALQDFSVPDDPAFIKVAGNGR
jgi:lysine N6-hydroxylase